MNYFSFYIKVVGPGYLSRYSNPLRAWRSGNRIPVGGGRYFPHHPVRPWGPSSLQYNGYRVLPGGERPGCGVDHPPQSSAEVQGRVELYICSSYGPSWPLLGWTLPLPSYKWYKAWCTTTPTPLYTGEYKTRAPGRPDDYIWYGGA
jgi:hypothetical protein